MTREIIARPERGGATVIGLTGFNLMGRPSSIPGTSSGVAWVMRYQCECGELPEFFMS